MRWGSPQICLSLAAQAAWPAETYCTAQRCEVDCVAEVLDGGMHAGAHGRGPHLQRRLGRGAACSCWECVPTHRRASYSAAAAAGTATAAFSGSATATASITAVSATPAAGPLNPAPAVRWAVSGEWGKCGRRVPTPAVGGGGRLEEEGAASAVRCTTVRSAV